MKLRLILISTVVALFIPFGQSMESWQKRFTVSYSVDKDFAAEMIRKSPSEIKALSKSLYDLMPLFTSMGAKFEMGDFMLLDLSTSELIVVNHLQQINLIEELVTVHFKKKLKRKTEPSH